MVTPDKVEPDKSKWDHSNDDPIVVTCSFCGSADVTRDATVRWDIASQTWELSGIFDDAHCDGCEDEASLEDTDLLEHLGKKLLSGDAP